MVVVGLHFGHDGAVCVIRDGLIVGYVTREREGGVKHALGVTTHELQVALAQANVAPQSIDAFAITTTQGVELLTGLIEDFSIVISRHPRDAVRSTYEELLKQAGIGAEKIQSYPMRELFLDSRPNPVQESFEAYFIDKDRYMRGEVDALGCIDDSTHPKEWAAIETLDQLATANLGQVFENQAVRNGFHLPLSVNFQGRSVPGYFIRHHVAHLASTYYRSGFNDATIFSHDGFAPGADIHSGAIGVGRGNTLVPVAPHHLVLGNVYETAAMRVLSTPHGAPGKMMGLAPYGKPRYFDPRFIGNWYEIKARTNMEHATAWMRHITDQVSRLHPSKANLYSRDHATEAINADIAASTQKLFEEGILRAVIAGYRMGQSSGLTSQNLCLSGGTALNCPANSLLYRDAPFDRIYIEPNCTDDGLSVGSSLYVYHHLHDNPLAADVIVQNQSPYQGPLHPRESLDALLTKADGLKVESVTNAAERAAQDIFENRVIGWFEGRSEMGPRALGHRSILSHPAHAGNWARVNEIKKRERWRPFAPAVLEEHATEWFSGAPSSSPYMLFTAAVRSRDVPAITHVDNSARLQTVSVRDGRYYEVLTHFHQLSGIPMVLNTSLNGPRQPIIEYPSDALEFLRSTKIDALYLDNQFRISRE